MSEADQQRQEEMPTAEMTNSDPEPEQEEMPEAPME